MRLNQTLVALAALATATIGIAQQAGQALLTVHIGTMDFATGTLSLAGVGMWEAVPGLSPLWNADGTRLLYVSGTGDAGGVRITVKVMPDGATKEIAPYASIEAAMSVTTDPDIVLIQGTNRSGESGVFQIDLPTGKSTMLATGARASFVSGDGRRLYFFRGMGAHHDLIENDLSTHRERTLVSYEHAPEIPESAYVSPDRTRVYYRMPAAGAKTPEPDSRIIERDLASGHERDVLSGHLGHLRPSPDGRYAVVRQLDPAGKWVAMRLLPLANARPATDLMRADGNASLFFSFWAPDSRSVFLRMPENGQPTSWWVPLEGQQQKALSRFVGSAAVHPNGTTIAFAANGG
jgi:Tol biopolymer transport system component